MNRSLHSAFLGLVVEPELRDDRVGQRLSGRTRESFNAGWRFARFGPMPEWIDVARARGRRWRVRATASSEESARGNHAEDVFDGDPQTRWCRQQRGRGRVGSARLGEQTLGRVTPEWEFPDLSYGSMIETSCRGQGMEGLCSRRHAVPPRSRNGFTRGQMG